MLLKIFNFGSQPEVDESDSPAQSEGGQEVAVDATLDATVGDVDVDGDGDDGAAKPKRTLKRILLQWSIGAGTLGVLGAIGLPMFLNSVSCGGAIKEIQGRTYAGSMNRAQQAFHLENGRFAQTWEELEIGGEQETEAYRFRTEVEGDLAVNYAVVRALDSGLSRSERREYERLFAVVGAAALQPQVPLSDVAVVVTSEESTPSASTSSVSASDVSISETESAPVLTQTILCQADEPGAALPPKPQLIDGQLACAPGTTDLKRS